MKSEIHNLQKELIDEKLKVRGLSEALEDPMNVHRWRKLEGTDSDTYEMITKIQTLQKRLIGKTEEVKANLSCFIIEPSALKKKLLLSKKKRA